MWEYNYTNELYHHGVKGMKWGKRKAQRLENKVGRKYKKAGVALGKSDYYKSEGDKAYKSHNSTAKAFEKQAKVFESKGNMLRAELARKSAASIRERGANIRAENQKMADRYAKKAEKNKEKASAFATKKRVDIGKNKINSIMSESRKKGYNSESSTNEILKEDRIRDRYGDSGLSVYKYAQGKS